MPRCCALGCLPNERGMLHVFPSLEKIPNQHKAWVKILTYKKDFNFDYKKLRICDRHFTEKDKTRSNRLNAMAVPSLFLPTCTPCKQSREESTEQINLSLLHVNNQEVTNSIELPIDCIPIEHDYCFSNSQDVRQQKAVKTTPLIAPASNIRIHQTTLRNLRREVLRLRKENHTLKLHLKSAEQLQKKSKVDKVVQTITLPTKLAQSQKRHAMQYKSSCVWNQRRPIMRKLST